MRPHEKAKAYGVTSLLSIGADAKTVKGESEGFLTAALYMAPADIDGANVCPWHTDACKANCIYGTGRQTKGVLNARAARKRLYQKNRPLFAACLATELGSFERKCKREGWQGAVRLNATSDILYERTLPDIFAEFPELTFYDYTKAPPALREELPGNYSLAWSWSNTDTIRDLERKIERGPLAVPFAPADEQAPKLPDSFEIGDFVYPVFDGDQNDLIFRYKPNEVIGLAYKGKGGSRPYYWQQKASEIFAVSVGSREAFQWR